MRIVVALVACLTSAGCLSVEAKFLAPPHPMICRDGRPVKILQHPDCTQGICGYSCVPGRWD